jgi:hypothetical protein
LQAADDGNVTSRIPTPGSTPSSAAFEHRDAMVRTQRDDALACPAVTVAGLETIAVEEAGDQVVASDQRQLAHGSDVSGGAVTLTAPALWQSELAANAT